MIPGTLSFLAIALFWAPPGIIIYSVYRNWIREKPNLFFIFIQVWGLVLAYKWLILFLLRIIPEPINQIALYLSVLPLTPEILFVKYILGVKYRPPVSHDDFLNVCAMLSFISSGAIGAITAGVRYYVGRKRQAV